MYEKYINNPFNHWRSLKIGQQLGDEDLTDPSFIFGCNNILDTERIEKKDIYLYEGDYFKTNGEDLEFCKYLKKKILNYFIHPKLSATIYKMMMLKAFQIDIGDTSTMEMV